MPIAVFVFATLITGDARLLKVQSAAAAAIAAERPRNRASRLPVTGIPNRRALTRSVCTVHAMWVLKNSLHSQQWVRRDPPLCLFSEWDLLVAVR